MQLKFHKMHGLGNDFVIINQAEQGQHLNHDNIIWRELADRNRGVGFDQGVFLIPHDHNKCQIIIFNADGSRVESCGNASRCVAKLMMDQYQSQQIIIQTEGGEILAFRGQDHANITINMGQVRDYQEAIAYAGGYGYYVNVGNPHLVIFDANLSDELMQQLEHHQSFPNRINVEKVSVINDFELNVKVWERGAGFTQACGTGACASVVAAIRAKKINNHHNIKVNLSGGNLTIDYLENGNMMMTGEASYSFHGMSTNFIV
jgi:diaminopimelate epimerase